jgi:hypothetical protein
MIAAGMSSLHGRIPLSDGHYTLYGEHSVLTELDRGYRVEEAGA